MKLAKKILLLSPIIFLAIFYFTLGASAQGAGDLYDSDSYNTTSEDGATNPNGQSTDPNSDGSDGSSTSSSASTSGDLAQKVREIYNNVVQYVAGPIAVLFLIFGGYLYITSTGNPEQIGQAKNLISTAIIALIVLLLAGMILNSIGQTPVTNPENPNTGGNSQEQQDAGDGEATEDENGSDSIESDEDQTGQVQDNNIEDSEVSSQQDREVIVPEGSAT
jgi:hypothetical protein